MSVEAASSVGEPPQIRAVIVDYGEVLCFLPASQDIERLAQIFQMDPQTFLSVYLPSRASYDRGDLLPAEYWDKFASQAGSKFDASILEDIRRLDVEMWCRHNESMIRWVEDIHAAGFRTAILSNMPPDMVAHVRNNFSWIGHFDHQIFSAEVRSVKPEPKIYRHCIETLGMDPSESLFIDDRNENLNQARAVGIRVLRFQSVAQLREDLRALGFTILPR